MSQKALIQISIFLVGLIELFLCIIIAVVQKHGWVVLIGMVAWLIVSIIGAIANIEELSDGGMKDE